MGNDGRDTLSGGGGNDWLIGGADADHLYGEADADWLTGGAGGDILNGGPGTDMASYWGSDAGVRVTLDEAGGATPSGGHAAGDTLRGIENLTGSSHRDYLTGNSGDNALNGMGGNDVISGGGGNDSLTGGAGADTLDGGEGERDGAGYGDSDAGVTVNLAAGTASGGHAEGDRLSGIESLSGSSHRDHLTGNSKDNGLVGSGGNDVISGGGGNDWLAGDAGADEINGGPGVDTASYTGSDAGVTVTLDEAGGATPSGGHAADDTLSGIEVLAGSAHGDVLTGNSKNNGLMGNDGRDTLSGGGGNDWLEGGAGADILDGGPGEDTLSYAGSDASVDVRLGPGTARNGHAAGDRIQGFENVVGSKHDDDLRGDETSNELSGGEGNDVLHGGGGDDELTGGRGDDWLIGGAGADTLRGGPGADHFAFPAANHSTSGEPDVVKDFSSSDRDLIDLSDLLRDSGWRFAGTEPFTGVAGEVRYAQRTGTAWTDVFVDVTGDGAADLVVQLEGKHDLTADDFYLG